MCVLASVNKESDKRNKQEEDVQVVTKVQSGWCLNWICV